MEELLTIIVILYLTIALTISTFFLVSREDLKGEDYDIAGMIGVFWPIIAIMAIMFIVAFVLIQLPTLPFRIIGRLRRH